MHDYFIMVLYAGASKNRSDYNAYAIFHHTNSMFCDEGTTDHTFHLSNAESTSKAKIDETSPTLLASVGEKPQVIN